MSFTPAASAPASGTSTPVSAAAATSAKDKRPALAGVKTKQRKGVAKAQAKFEPTVFRDDLLKALSSAPKNDYEATLRILEASCNELDFRKYEIQLFELIIVGRLLAPGGNVIVDGSEECPFSVLGTDKENMKEVVGVLGKLIRRYKYLQKPLEESSLPAILQYANKLDKPASASTLAAPGATEGGSTPGTRSGATTPQPGAGQAALAAQPLPSKPNVEKLGVFSALSVASGLVTPAILSSLKKDHLVKDSTSLVFLLNFLKTFITPTKDNGAGETVDQAIAALKRGGNTDLLDFFPLAKRSQNEVNKEFKARGLDKIAEWYAKIVEGSKREQVAAKLKEMTSEDERASNDEIIAYLNDTQKVATPIPEPDLIGIIWTGLFANLDTSATSQQVTDAALKWVKSINPVLAKFTNGARTEIALINAIQVYIYDTVSLHAIFAKIIQLLYNDDVLSSTAIFYWFEKGAKPNGKQTFLKQMSPLVDAIKKSEEDDEDEDDDE